MQSSMLANIQQIRVSDRTSPACLRQNVVKRGCLSHGLRLGPMLNGALLLSLSKTAGACPLFLAPIYIVEFSR